MSSERVLGGTTGDVANCMCASGDLTVANSPEHVMMLHLADGLSSSLLRHMRNFLTFVFILLHTPHLAA